MCIAGAHTISSYLIASSPRTGSYLLCEGLQSTGTCGHPSEPFCPDFREEYCSRWGLPVNASFSTYLSTVVRAGTTENGVFGTKIHWMQVHELATEAGCVGLLPGEVLNLLFPQSKYIHLRRRDRRGQAISYHRALSTRVWLKINGTKNHQANGKEAAFDSAAIRDLEVFLDKEDQAWFAFFERQDIEPLVIHYEDLAENYDATIARVTSFIWPRGHQQVSGRKPRLMIQSDEVTRQWRERMDKEDLSYRIC